MSAAPAVSPEPPVVEVPPEQPVAADSPELSDTTAAQPNTPAAVAVAPSEPEAEASTRDDSFVLPLEDNRRAELWRAQSKASVRLLGGSRLIVEGRELSGVRRRGHELLAWLCLHEDGATLEVATEALVPDVDGTRAREQLYQAMHSLRSALRTAFRDEDADPFEWTGEKCRVNRRWVSCDVWELEDALARAALATTSRECADALDAVVDAAARGPLLEGLAYEWAEPLRRDLTQRTIAALVDGAADGPAALSLAALERAVELDPYDESLYVSLAERLARTGQPRAARSVALRAAERMAELEVDLTDVAVERLRRVGISDLRRPEPAAT